MRYFLNREATTQSPTAPQKRDLSGPLERPIIHKRQFRNTLQSGFMNLDGSAPQRFMMNPSLSYRILALEEED